MELRALTLDQLREEYRRNGMCSLVWQWVAYVLNAYLRGHYSDRYRFVASSGQDEYTAEFKGDLVTTYIVLRLTNRKHFGRLLLATTDIIALSRLLETDFHRWLTRRGRTTSGNLLRRLRDSLAETDEFVDVAGYPAVPYYGLRSWGDEPRAIATTQMLAGAERHLPADLRLKTYESDHRRSPVLERSELIRSARALIHGVGAAMSPRQIITVLGRRFDLSEPKTIQVDDTDGELGGPVLNPLTQLVADETARALIKRLTPRQRTVLRLRVGDPPLTDRAIAVRLGCGKSTVNNEWRTIRSLAHEHELTPEEATQAFRQLVTILDDEDSL